MLRMIIAGVLFLQVDIYDPGSGAFLDSMPDAEVLFMQADSAYGEGDYETSAAFYLQGLHAQPWNSGSIYNLACCYGLLGEGQLASFYLERAWKAGFDDIGHILWDPDFDNVREMQVFSSLVDSLQEAAALKDEQMGEEVFFTANGPFRCRVQLPEGYDGSEPVPLVLGIHGLGDSPDRFIGLWDVISDYGCIFAVPQAPTPFLVGNRIGYTWYVGEDDASWTASAIQARDYLLTLLDKMESDYSITEVYLFGYSQGGGMTYMAGLHSPGRFAALAAFSGWLDLSVLTEEEIDAASAVPVRIVHGEQDRVVEYGAALFADSLLSDRGYDVELITFQGQHMFHREALAAFLEEFVGSGPQETGE
ncbi:MAG: dienelactone hydrolase family protein [Candidatus Fermentibacteraceae bacterium]|nr:dienelactone hydrolase family protein [Candidatus Fermentibacteraceae bacterium]MBN2609802.1 dienelactone hydrolase family protein [Candidatus Fermentibacteraceae bacterium]